LATETTQPYIEPAGRPEAAKSKRALIFAAIVVLVGVLGVTLPQFQVLGYIPLNNLLKNALHQNRASTAAFFFWIQAAWYFKPFFGIVTDAFPFFGTRRKSYILTGAALSVACFIVLLFTPHRYGSLLTVCVAINVFMVLTSTAVGGFMVETGQAFGATGRLASVFNFVSQGSYVIAGPVGGFLGAISFGWTAAAGAATMFLVVPATMIFLKERRKRIESKKLLREAGNQLKSIVNAKTMWAAAAFSALFYCAPGISTAEFYQQQNVMHLSTEGQGILMLLQGAFAVLAATLYGTFFCRRFNLRWLLIVCITVGAASQFGYAFYTTFHRAWFIDSFYGLGWTAADMTLMDLAMRATPTASEALGFSLMMSVRNLSLFGSNWAGSKVMDMYHLPLSTMATANALISLIAVPFVFFLPAFIVDRRDSVAEAEELHPAAGKIALEE
jgi:predicted MFS family arabinose efflux permease